MNSVSYDIRSIMARDPAARSKWEVMLCYPGFHAVLLHRVAHGLHARNRKMLARMVAAFNRFLTGVDIHPAAVIGKGLFIDHGVGVVIGETVEIGDDVTIYQGVTLGGTGKISGKRHPTIGNHVVISAGAKVLGPFKVGDYSKVGAGAVVLKEVPPHCTVVGIPGKIVKRNGRSDRAEDDLEQTKLPDPVGEQLAEMAAMIRELKAELDELKSKQEEMQAREPVHA
ncbi:serine O-acetyltransferase [Paenibacillus turpanensis]|uniref:serine O-acetyltransferase n=1 Tax=Paenibacillus turpanensis TaxID=2689078 RepID=UPI002443412B|nr:serine O-acetyltransferase [Paenibacillus turpanensis]